MRRNLTCGLVAGAVASALALTACGGASEAGDDGSTTLDVELFGTMGFEEAGLFDQYEQENPGVTINYSSTQEEADYWTALQTRLRAGDAPDVVGLEIARIADVTTNQADSFADMAELVPDATEGYPSWKSDAATVDGGKVVGLGTDAGPMAICYRSDLFEQAGLPSDPAGVSALFASGWDAYLEAGRQFQASAPAGTAWVDAASGLYSAILSTETEQYYDEAGEEVWDSNPAVRDAFDTAASAGADGLTAKLQQFSPEWNQGFTSGSFATLACPAWMLGYIEGQAGDAGAGTWNVADLPGDAGGNWGGSYLAVPESSDSQQAAADLVAWLTAPEQQVALFNDQGAFPSREGALEQIGDVTSEYFQGAAIGQIFGDAAGAAPVQVLGINDGVYRTQLSNALTAVEANGLSAEEAWETASEEIENQAS